jgi:hypothetical protein
MTDALADLMATEARRRAALLAGDADTLDAILTDDFLYVHSTGFAEGKAPFLDRMRNKLSRFTGLKAWGEKVRQHPGCAIMDGSVDMPYEAIDGSSGEIKALFVATWIQTPGGWRLAAYASTARGAPPAFDKRD